MSRARRSVGHAAGVPGFQKQGAAGGKEMKGMRSSPTMACAGMRWLEESSSRGTTHAWLSVDSRARVRRYPHPTPSPLACRTACAGWSPRSAARLVRGRASLLLLLPDNVPHPLTILFTCRTACAGWSPHSAARRVLGWASTSPSATSSRLRQTSCSCPPALSPAASTR